MKRVNYNNYDDEWFVEQYITEILLSVSTMRYYFTSCPLKYNSCLQQKPLLLFYLLERIKEGRIIRRSHSEDS